MTISRLPPPDPRPDTPMKLAIDRLTSKPTEHRYSPRADWWSEWSGGEAEAGPVLLTGPEFVVEARARGEEVSIRGRVVAEVEVECSRCLKRYRHALSDSFQLVLDPIGDRRPPDPEGEECLERFGMVLSDELEAGWYEGKEVSLDPWFAEVTALAMPVQPLCSEDCAGLCPHCGIDRNQASCDCTDERPDSPFAVLAALRDRSGGSI